MQLSNGKRKPKNIEKILRDVKLLEILGSGLDRKTLEMLKDFSFDLTVVSQRCIDNSLFVEFKNLFKYAIHAYSPEATDQWSSQKKLH